MINKYDNIPLYSQLKMILISKIEDGVYTENSKIPSEQELCEMYDISRPTVRQAISELTNSGHLYKEKGKGTYVSEKKTRIDIKNYSGFTDSILDRQESISHNIISTKSIDIHKNNKLKEIFNLPNSSVKKFEFAEITYTTICEEELVSFNVSYIPLFFFPDIIEDVNLQKLPHEILKGKYPLLPVRSRSNLEIMFSDQSDSHLLRIQTGQPLIKIENTLLSKNNTVVEHIISKYRADKCKILFENII